PASHRRGDRGLHPLFPLGGREREAGRGAAAGRALTANGRARFPQKRRDPLAAVPDHARRGADVDHPRCGLGSATGSPAAVEGSARWSRPRSPDGEAAKAIASRAAISRIAAASITVRILLIGATANEARAGYRSDARLAIRTST